MKYLCIHNGGGLADNPLAKTQHLTAENIDNAHRARFNMISTLGWFGGYNFFIEKDGKLTQFRAISEETMAQRGHNFDTVSICLAGNFTNGVEYPTKEQIAMLEKLGGALVLKDTETLMALKVKFMPNTTLNITLDRVLPHRLLQPGTECYGSALVDSWGRQIITRAFVKKINVIQEMLLAIQDKLRRMSLGGLKGRTPCSETHTIG